MNFHSITFKILTVVTIAFCSFSSVVIYQSNKQTIKIIDSSQNKIYHEKIDLIYRRLTQLNERLNKTPRSDMYFESFQNIVIKNFKNIYYDNNIKATNNKIYPFIATTDGRIVIHPILPKGYTSPNIKKLIAKMAEKKFNQFNANFTGETKWYISHKFEPGNWIIAYAVPLKIKYQDANKLHNLLVFNMVIGSIIVLFILFLFLTNITKPIHKLTKVAVAIAEGDLEANISYHGKNEIGILATSFITMRDAIKQQLITLKNEIKERTKAEQDLNITLNSIGDAVLVVNASGEIIRMNPVAQKLTGWDFKDAKNKQLDEVFNIISTNTRKKVTSPLKKVLKTNGVVGLANHTLLIKKNKEEIHIADSGAPIRDKEGKIIGVVLVFRDITEQYKLEEQIKQNQRLDSIGLLAGGVAHDFNNIITGIMGAAELLRSPKSNLNERGQKYANLIVESSKRAAKLTSKLLAFSRKSNIVFTTLDIEQLLSETVYILKNTIDKKIKISLECNAENKIILGNKSAIQNVFINLGINASHAMPNGGELNFKISNIELNEAYCKKSTFELNPGEYIQIDTIDTGCGIEKDILDKIFEPFFTTKQENSGTGLGLSTAYGTIREHNGFVSVYSELDIGTVFHVFIPCAKTKTANKPANYLPTKSSKSLNILFVDDEDIIRETSQAILEELGHKVSCAENGKEAVELFQKIHSNTDLIIMDMIMPEMNGSEAFFLMRKIAPNAQIIITSGFTKDEDIANLKENGLFCFLNKPFNKNQLQTMINQLINKK